MGVLTEYFITTSDNAANMNADAFPTEMFEGVELKGVDNVILAELDAMLRGVAFDEAVAASTMIQTLSDDGPWVLSLASELVNALANLSDTASASLALRWIECEELAGWTSEDAAYALDQLRFLAKKAVSSGLDMFLWLSL